MIGEVIIHNYLRDVDNAQRGRNCVVQKEIDYSFDLWLDKLNAQPLIMEMDGIATVFEHTSGMFSTYRD